MSRVRAAIVGGGLCGNLLVPVALSASHIAFGSVRMEPVFMILAESAAVAACLAIDGGETVHALSYDRLKTSLESRGQILSSAASNIGSENPDTHR